MSRTIKALPGYKYVANFADEPVRLGMIYRMDDEQFIPALHLNDAFPGIDLSRFVSTGAPGQMKFSRASDVAITLGGSATSKIGKSEIKLSFKRSKSVVGVLNDAITESLGYENVLPQLKELWTERGYTKFAKDYVFVFQVVTAASGTMVYSLESKNEVVLAHALGAPVKSVGELGSGQFEYVSNTKRTLEVIRQVAHRPLFKAFWFRKGFVPEILG